MDDEGKTGHKKMITHLNHIPEYFQTFAQKDRINSKLKAAGLHLLGSFLVVGVVSLVVFLIWYPFPYFLTDGTVHIVIMIAAVDLVVGPLCTFLIYLKGKKGLWFDMAFIILIQLVAIIYGTYTLYSQRPAYAVFNKDRFDVVAVSEIDLNAIPENIQSPAWYKRPSKIFVGRPESIDLQQEIMFIAVSTGKDWQHYPEYYEPLEKNIGALQKRFIDLSKLLKKFPKYQPMVKQWLDKQDINSDELGYIPLLGRKTSVAVVYDKSSGKEIGILSVPVL